jgi:hypothetical protein
VYNYVDSLDAPKRWFKAVINDVLRVYAGSRMPLPLLKEDILLGQLVIALSLTFIYSGTVIGTLDTPDHAQFVSHTHPDSQVCFQPSIYPSPILLIAYSYISTSSLRLVLVLPGENSRRTPRVRSMFLALSTTRAHRYRSSPQVRYPTQNAWANGTVYSLHD